MNVLLHKFKEVLSAVAPVVVLVIILNLTLTPVPGELFVQFIIGAVAIIIGLAILLFGIEIGILPFGENMGSSFVKSNRLWYVILIGFLLGFFVNIAEPDLQVLAAEVSDVMGGYISLMTILVTVSIGTGLMLALGVTRIVKSVPLNIVFIIIYGVIAVLSLLSSSDMMAIGFDSSGATTGALTTPLVLALSLGVASMKRDSKSSEEDSFGLVGIMSTGAILSVMILNIFVKTDNIVPNLPERSVAAGLFGPFIEAIPIELLHVFIALLPLVIMLLIFQKIKFKLHRKTFFGILRGFIYTFVGLVIFLTGVNAGFMNVGNIIGKSLASYENKAVLVGLGFILGLLVILVEPAVYVLTRQIEDVTNGYVKRKTVLVTLSIGVAFAVSLSMLRIAIPGIQLWHYILPGFAISLFLTFFAPKIFVGIAFDSGGVASGPMTATFVLALSQGASDAMEHSNILIDSFGVIAMVAMTPIIALQVLGLIYKVKSKKSEVLADGGIL